MSHLSTFGRTVKQNARSIGYGLRLAPLPEGLPWAVCPTRREVVVSPTAEDLNAAAIAGLKVAALQILRPTTEVN